jgi:hypothetical protein
MVAGVSRRAQSALLNHRRARRAASTTTGDALSAPLQVLERRCAWLHRQAKGADAIRNGVIPAGDEQYVEGAVLSDRLHQRRPGRIVEVVGVVQLVDRRQHRTIGGLGPAVVGVRAVRE